MIYLDFAKLRDTFDTKIKSLANLRDKQAFLDFTRESILKWQKELSAWQPTKPIEHLMASDNGMPEPEEH